MRIDHRRGLAEWEDAATVAWSSLFEVTPRGFLVISHHANGDYYLVLDTATSEYRWYDLQDFDNPRVVGTNLTETLDWLWIKAQELAPGRDAREDAG